MSHSPETEPMVECQTTLDATIILSFTATLIVSVAWLILETPKLELATTVSASLSALLMAIRTIRNNRKIR